MKLGEFDPERHGVEAARVKNIVVKWLNTAERDPTSMFMSVTRSEITQLVAWLTIVEDKLDKLAEAGNVS